MANPMPNEAETYDKIKKEKVTIHPLVWQLIDHHINNDLYMINLIIGSTTVDGQPLSGENANKILNHTKAISDFLRKLESVTEKKSKDV